MKTIQLCQTSQVPRRAWELFRHKFSVQVGQSSRRSPPGLKLPPERARLLWGGSVSATFNVTCQVAWQQETYFTPMYECFACMLLIGKSHLYTIRVTHHLKSSTTFSTQENSATLLPSVAHHCFILTAHDVMLSHRLFCGSCSSSIFDALTPCCTTNLDGLPAPRPSAVHSSHLGLPGCRYTLGSNVLIKLIQ